jgi:hypothetical protein
VTIQLPAPNQYGVVAGEVDLQSAAGPGAATAPLRAVVQRPTTLPVAIPANRQEPEAFLRILAVLARPQRRATLRTAVGPGVRKAMTATQACNVLRGAAAGARTSGQNAVPLHLVQAICKAGGKQFSRR